MSGNNEGKGTGGLSIGAKIGIVAALVVLVGVAIYAQKHKAAAKVETPQTAAAEASAERPKSALPKLIDLGADKCIPCKMMAPILEELKKDYEGKMDVVFIDVWKNVDAGKQYGINLIPTQIFYDASGKELFRHEGFFAREDILAKWKELGIDLAASSDAQDRRSVGLNR